MPQLPSGRHIGIQANTLWRLVDQAMQGTFVHHLMAIEDTDRLLVYLDVIELRPAAEGAPPPDLAPNSDSPPPGLTAHDSGMTVRAALSPSSNWTREDKAALETFLQTPRIRTYLDQLLEEVEKAKERVRADGTWTAQVLAAWWDVGVHPLQPGNEED